MAKKNNKVIITCAVTGGIHVPSMSDYLPLTPEEISKQSIDAANAGASILHLHARDPKNGRPTSDPNICLLYTSPSPRDTILSRMPSSA